MIFRYLLLTILVISAVNGQGFGRFEQQTDEYKGDEAGSAGQYEEGQKGQQGGESGGSNSVEGGEAGPEPPAVVPQTSFTCDDKPYNPGMYADMEVDCSVYHMCFDGRKESFLCGTGTMFNQEILSCDHPQKVDCKNSPSYYNANEELGKPGAEPAPGGDTGKQSRPRPGPAPAPRPGPGPRPAPGPRPSPGPRPRPSPQPQEPVEEGELPDDNYNPSPDTNQPGYRPGPSKPAPRPSKTRPPAPLNPDRPAPPRPRPVQPRPRPQQPTKTPQPQRPVPQRPVPQPQRPVPQPQRPVVQPDDDEDSDIAGPSVPDQPAPVPAPRPRPTPPAPRPRPRPRPSKTNPNSGRPSKSNFPRPQPKPTVQQQGDDQNLEYEPSANQYRRASFRSDMNSRGWRAIVPQDQY